MALNTDFMIAPSLQEYFIDKDTGLPLRGGKVYSFADQARTTPKPIYQLTGSAPNYTYSELPNPVTLTINGTFSDGNNNDILPYYYPFDDDGNVELYYLTVYSSTGVFQFSRQGYPNVAGSGSSISALDNYIPNGQFLFNYMQNAHGDLVQGQIQTNSTGITNIAQGGWTFERNPTSTATDIVTFTSEGIQDPSLPGLPRWVLNVETTSIGTNNTFKDIRIKFDDVNTFASTTQKYTFGFSGIDRNGGNTQVQLVLIKNFGTGGSSATSTTLTTFNLSSSWDNYVFSFAFGTNGAFTIGDENDDFVQLALRLPVSNLISVSFTDVMMPQGEFSKSDMIFPETTNSQFSYQTLTAPRAQTDGSDLFLPIRLGPQGLIYDDSELGDVVTESQNADIYVDSLHPTTNRMLGDGNQYPTDGYSPLGIPYARLQAKYFDSTVGAPIWGTGRDYFVGILQDSNVEVRIVNNQGGAVTNAADGSSPTGFSIITSHVGVASYAVQGYYEQTNVFAIVDNNVGGTTASTAGTSGFIVSTDPGGSDTVQVTRVQTVAGAALAGATGKYFTFSSNADYFVWYNVDNASAQPVVPGFTPIEIKINSDYSAASVANITREAINGWQLTSIRAVAGNVLPAGSFFTINSSTGSGEINYYVWYTVDGAGTDPAPLGKIAIKVDVLSTDTAAQINQKTQLAINNKFFASPDLRNAFLRGLSLPTSSTTNPWITDWGARLITVPGFQNNGYGSYELDTFRQHNHPGSVADLEASAGGGPGDGYVQSVATAPATLTLDITPQGYTETRPKNVGVVYVIKY
jgi:hypothetical protein